MYGGGMKHNPIFRVQCMTYRKGGIFQHATIGGGHPWFTDNMLQLWSIEADIYDALKRAGIDVLDVRADPGGLSNIAYPRIRTSGGGDAKQALAIMPTCSRRGLPKIGAAPRHDHDPRVQHHDRRSDVRQRYAADQRIAAWARLHDTDGRQLEPPQLRCQRRLLGACVAGSRSVTCHGNAGASSASTGCAPPSSIQK